MQKQKPKRKKRNGSRRRKETWEQQMSDEADECGAGTSKDTEQDQRLDKELNRLTRDVAGTL